MSIEDGRRPQEASAALPPETEVEKPDTVQEAPTATNVVPAAESKRSYEEIKKERLAVLQASEGRTIYFASVAGRTDANTLLTLDESIKRAVEYGRAYLAYLKNKQAYEQSFGTATAKAKPPRDNLASLEGYLTSLEAHSESGGTPPEAGRMKENLQSAINHYGSNPEEVAASFRRDYDQAASHSERRFLQRVARPDEAAMHEIENQAAGFADTALESGDLYAAIESYAFAKKLDAPAVAAKVEEHVQALNISENPNDQHEFTRVAALLAKIDSEKKRR